MVCVVVNIRCQTPNSPANYFLMIAAVICAMGPLEINKNVTGLA